MKTVGSIIKAVKETLTIKWAPKTMLKHKIRILFCGKISHVYLKSSNFRRVGPVNQFKSIYKIIERGEGGSQKKLRGLGGLYRSICQNPRSSVHKLHS